MMGRKVSNKTGSIYIYMQVHQEADGIDGGRPPSAEEHCIAHSPDVLQVVERRLHVCHVEHTCHREDENAVEGWHHGTAGSTTPSAAATQTSTNLWRSSRLNRQRQNWHYATPNHVNRYLMIMGHSFVSSVNVHVSCLSCRHIRTCFLQHLFRRQGFQRDGRGSIITTGPLYQVRWSTSKLWQTALRWLVPRKSVKWTNFFGTLPSCLLIWAIKSWKGIYWRINGKAQDTARETIDGAAPC